MQENFKISSNVKEEISLKELLQKINETLSFLITQWVKFLFIAFIGGTIGFIYAWLKPPVFSAKITFVVEDAKSSGLGSLGGLASIAGQFGVDVGGGAGGGLLAGDNILLYFKSTSLARKVLLSEFDKEKKQSLADKYVEVYNLDKKWESNAKIGKVNFPPISVNSKYTRLQDSLLNSIIAIINKTQFVVAKTDKKAGFIEVVANMQNELLAKTYCEKVVNDAVERYINVKTKRQKETVDKLQYRVDSIAKLLSQKTFSGAALQTSSSTMDINPLYKTGTAVAVETTIRDKTMLATIFATVTQNLEIAKFTLSQETPAIQIVDTPDLPLYVVKQSKLQSAIVLSFLFSLIFAIYLLVNRAIKSI